MNRGDDTRRDRPRRGGDETWPVVEAIAEPSEPEDLISLSQLMSRFGEPGEGGAREAPHGEPDDLEDAVPVPRITRMPEGFRVEERRVGRAVAQWILHVRCECGRRWFEVDTVDTATCPRCGVLVYVDVDARGVRP